MRLLNKFGFDDEAVSPVVGVILMVAITVILAAVIGTFVLDLGGQVQQNAQAGVTFDENEGVSLEVQLNSVQNADHIYVQSSTGALASTAGGAAWQGSTANPTSGNDQFIMSDDAGGVGTTVVLNSSNGGYSSGEQATVIGIIDGSENIIQTYQMGG